MRGRSRPQARPFQVTRNGLPIEDLRIKDAVDPHISFSMSFLEWEAAVAAGASREELYKWETRGYPKSFMARVVAWYQYHCLVKTHQEDAARPHGKKGK